MHIVLDTRIIETSTGRYMQRLLEGINDHYAADEHTYTALMPSAHVKKWQKRLPHITIVAADQKWYTIAEQWSFYLLLRRLKPDLVHFTMPQQPFLWTGPAVTTIHDMTLIKFDNLGNDDNPLVYRVKKQVFLQLVRTIMRRAAAIITPTNFVRNDLAQDFGKQYLPKIHTTYEAGEIPEVSPEPVAALKGKRFLFFVGNAFPYKNVWRVVEAFRELQRDYPDLELALAGKKDEFYKEIEQRVKDEAIPGVHVLGFVSDGEKRWLFQTAECFVTASLSEGFCVPLLEAMIEGTPVVAANVSCLPEVVGSAGLLFDPHSTKALVETITPLLDSQKLRSNYITLGKKRAAEFSWNRMVAQTIDIYMKILSKRP